MSRSVRERLSSPAISRRMALASGTITGVFIATERRAFAWTPGTQVIDVTAEPYNASQNSSDNTSAFQMALTQLASLGGGTLV